MTTREFAAVLFATLGIFLGTQALVALPFLLMYSPFGPIDSYDSESFVLLATGFAVQLATAGLLVLARQPLAARLFEESTPGDFRVDGADLTRALLAALGAYFVTTGLAHELPTAVQGYASDPSNTRNPTFWRWAIQLAIGATLLFSARGIAGAIALLRDAGPRRT